MDTLLHLVLLTASDGAQCPVGALEEHWGVLLQPMCQVTQKMLVLRRTQNESRLCKKSRLPRQLLRRSGHVIQQVQWSSKWQRQTGCCSEPLAAPVGESQFGPSGFWPEVLPSSAGGVPPSETQLLASYRTLAETKCLTSGHRVTT